MGERLRPQPVDHARMLEHTDCSALDGPGTNSSGHILGSSALEDHGIDPAPMEQLPEQPSCRACTDYRGLRSHLCLACQNRMRRKARDAMPVRPPDGLADFAYAPSA
jgi:hypothetical protein